MCGQGGCYLEVDGQHGDAQDGAVDLDQAVRHGGVIAARGAHKHPACMHEREGEWAS